MSQPTADPLEPDQPDHPDLDAAPDDAAPDPVRDAEDEVIAELEESLQEAEHHDLYPYQAVVLATGEGPAAADRADERQSRELARQLQAELDRRGVPVPVLVGHRRVEPHLTDTLREAHEQGMTQVLAVTTGAYSSYPSCREHREDIAAAIDTLLEEGRSLHVDKVRQYWNHPGFSRAQARIVTECARGVLEAGSTPYLLLVTPSLPAALDDTSGPGDDEGNLYSAQHLELAAAIAEEASATLGTTLEHDLVYSGRPQSEEATWLGPDVLDHLRTLAGRGVAHVVLAAVGVVCEEAQLLDLDALVAGLAQELGVEVLRAPTVASDPEFVMGLADLALERAAQARGVDVELVTWPGADPRPAVCPPGCCPNLAAARPAACGRD